MKKSEMKTKDLFDLNHTMTKPFLEKYDYPWEALEDLGNYIRELGASLPKSEYDNPADGIWISKSAKMARTAGLMAPVIIGPAAELRHCAYIRGNVIVGANAVVGNSTELKNTILFDFVQVPHYNYVGDSILGFRAHMGAGSITSNVKADKKPVQIHAEDGEIDTGRKKVGAMIGDGADIGCNAVLNPGTIIGKNSNVYPLSSVRGCVDAGSIYKKQGEIAAKKN
ncbi:MAG: UDP-N-acetylglucosamine pyrophosphorylase [Clostridiales bacterium]|nr:UDP-N-acetylglucosamine pyrophosphorylase [Clostridiales bacterium]